MKTDLRERVFRANRRYELVDFDRLTESERETLRQFLADASLFGVLKPRSGGVARVVDRDMALLLLTLRRPGPLPGFLRADFEPSALRRWVRGLLASGVLEVAEGDTFLTGAEAVAVIEDGASDLASSALARLSEEALRHAAVFCGDDREALARRLYGFHRLPLTPHWLRRLPDEIAVARWLGVDGAAGRKLETNGGLSEADSWISWSRHPARAAGETHYKLYLSPLPEGLPAVLEILADELPKLAAFQLKVGRRVVDLLRPDKLMVYFSSFDELGEAAQLLTERLDGLGTHGVPFTAEIGGGGLLSWGADPAPSRRLFSWRPRESWRSWITDRLALALLAAREEADGEPWRIALAQLHLEGVDVHAWSPDSRRWIEQGG